MSATTLRSFSTSSPFTDNDTRASSVNGYTDALSRTLDNDTRYGRFSQFLSQVLTYFKIAVQLSANSLVFANRRVPWFYNTRANTIRCTF